MRSCSLSSCLFCHHQPTRPINMHTSPYQLPLTQLALEGTRGYGRWRATKGENKIIWRKTASSSSTAERAGHLFSFCCNHLENRQDFKPLIHLQTCLQFPQDPRLKLIDWERCITKKHSLTQIKQKSPSIGLREHTLAGWARDGRCSVNAQRKKIIEV